VALRLKKKQIQGLGGASLISKRGGRSRLLRQGEPDRCECHEKTKRRPGFLRGEKIRTTKVGTVFFMNTIRYERKWEKMGANKHRVGPFDARGLPYEREGDLSRKKEERGTH